MTSLLTNSLYVNFNVPGPIDRPIDLSKHMQTDVILYFKNATVHFKITCNNVRNLQNPPQFNWFCKSQVDPDLHNFTAPAVNMVEIGLHCCVQNTNVKSFCCRIPL